MQSDAFLSAGEGSRCHPVFTLAILTGLRRGELLALRWQDVDLERREVTVRQTLIDRNGRLETQHAEDAPLPSLPSAT